MKTTSILASSDAAELYNDFRRRVADYAADVRKAVDAFLSQDPEAFFRVIDGLIGDGAFDTALAEAFKRREIAPEIYDGLMYSLIEAASSVSIDDPDQNSFTTTELFALPVTGSMQEIMEFSGSFARLASTASLFSSAGYVSEGVRVILSPTTIDPRAAARLTCAIAREMALSFVPHFDSGYTPQSAEDLFEAVQGPFEFLGDPTTDHLAETGRVTRLIIGATQRLHSRHHPTTGDAFIANIVDENDSDALQDISDRFLGALNEVTPGGITLNFPFTITRGAAFSALSAAIEGLNEEAALVGVRRPDFLLDEIIVARHGETVMIEGLIGDHELGPVVIQDQLVRRDIQWFKSSLSRLCEDFSERTVPTVRRTLN